MLREGWCSKKGAPVSLWWKKGNSRKTLSNRIRPLVSLLSLSARDAAVQRGVLLHAVCSGCLWLAHIPDEEAHMWTLSPGQILLVSDHPIYHSAFSSSLFPSVFPGFRNTLSFISLLSITPLFLPLPFFFCIFSSFPFSCFFFPSLSNSVPSYFLLNLFHAVAYLLTLLNKLGCLVFYPLWCTKNHASPVQFEQPAERSHLAQDCFHTESKKLSWSSESWFIGKPRYAGSWHLGLH